MTYDEGLQVTIGTTCTGLIGARVLRLYSWFCSFHETCPGILDGMDRTISVRNITVTS